MFRYEFVKMGKNIDKKSSKQKFSQILTINETIFNFRLGNIATKIWPIKKVLAECYLSNFSIPSFH